jgi:hypothetical protein
MASKVISTRLDESKVDELDLKASELGITRNELISKVLLEFLGVDKTVDNLYTSVDKTVDSDILKLVDSAVDNRIQFLIERIDSLENAIAKQNTTESNLLFHSEIVAPVRSDEIEPDALVSEKATSPAKKSITYQIAKDGSIVLRSLRGTDSRTLKRMNTQELKEIGLFKTLIGANEKFFPI